MKNVRVPIAKLPKALSGYTIVQLTDIHVGPTIGREFIEQIVRTTNALSPDVVAITGDLVDGSVDAARRRSSSRCASSARRTACSS